MRRLGLERALGAVVQTHRKKAGLSQEELAFRAGLHRTFISQLERGLKSPSLRTLVAVSEVLGISPDQLIRETVGLAGK
jgi:transcriptional regulator with XRE-family HTH domain